MTKQITLEEALKLVSFEHRGCWGWRVHDVKGDVKGDIHGDVWGTINGHKFIGTPRDKLQSLIEESGNQELIDTFNQLEETDAYQKL